MGNLNTLCDESRESMTMERATQLGSRRVLRLRPSMRLVWRLGGLALGVMTLIGVTESGRTFASLVTDTRARGEQSSVLPVLQPSLRSEDVPLERTSRERELLRSIEHGDVAQAESLLAAGVSANSKDLQGWSPLMMAALHNRLTLIPTLFVGGVDPNAQNAKGTTALMLAANNGHAEMVRELLARGAKVNARAKDGWTALMYAAWKGDAAITADLLRAGADSSLKDSQHWTAGMYAAWQGHTAAVEVLFRGQGGKGLSTAERKQARLLADRQGHAEVVRLCDEMEKRG